MPLKIRNSDPNVQKFGGHRKAKITICFLFSIMFQVLVMKSQMLYLKMSLILAKLGHIWPNWSLKFSCDRFFYRCPVRLALIYDILNTHKP